MRRLVVVIMAVALALTLTACGGGGEEAAEAPAEEAAPAAAPAAAEEEEQGTDNSPTEEQVYEPFPTDPEVVPQDILDRIEDGQPMMIVLYDGDPSEDEYPPGQATTGVQRDWVNEVAMDYPGLIDVLSYNLGKYVDSDEDGVVTIVPEGSLEEDEETTPEEMAEIQIATLASSEWLDVKFTPYIFIVDGDGYITYRVRGPIDSDMLEGQVLRATD